MFTQDEIIIVRARVIRQRGTTVEAQLPDGNLLRIDAVHVRATEEGAHVGDAAPAKGRATHKAVKMSE